MIIQMIKNEETRYNARNNLNQISATADHQQPSCSLNVNKAMEEELKENGAPHALTL